MKQYLNLLADVLENGRPHHDRTGKGTLSVFGRQVRFDIRAGFPALTTKRISLKRTWYELMWFLSGSCNINDLHPDAHHWWSPWAKPDGDLGETYGRQWRSLRGFRLAYPRWFTPPSVALDESFNTVSAYDYILRDEWSQLLDQVHRSLGRDHTTWQSYHHFVDDAVKLPGWNLKRTFPRRYVLTMDVLAPTNRYGVETCKWSSVEEKSINDNFDTFTYTQGLRPRYDVVDQLATLIAGLHHEPNSRRHLVSLWNSAAVDHQQLPCCHGTTIQCKVEDGVLHMETYQRSADLFVGVPVNIASYAFLLTLLADLTGYEAGELVYTFGDLHLYNDHHSLARQQLCRTPRDLPKVTISTPAFGDPIEKIENTGWHNVQVVGYDPSPSIKAPVAV